MLMLRTYCNEQILTSVRVGGMVYRWASVGAGSRARVTSPVEAGLSVAWIEVAARVVLKVTGSNVWTGSAGNA